MTLSIKEFDEQMDLAADEFRKEFIFLFKRFMGRIELTVDAIDEDVPKHLAIASVNNAMKQIEEMDLDAIIKEAQA